MRHWKHIFTAALVAMVCLPAFGETAFEWSGPQQTGTLTYDGLNIENSTVAWTNEATGLGLTLSGDLDVDGTSDLDDVDIDGTFNAAGTFTLAATALNVTNGQAITVSAGTYVLSGTGSADNGTNTITLVAPAAAGQLVTLIMATASSNLVAIADSGTAALATALELDGNDTAVLQAVDTSTWCQIGTSDN